MLIELEKEPQKLRLHYPSTELVISPILLPIRLTSKISDEKGSLWYIEFFDIAFDGRHKKDPFVNVRGSIIAYKDNKRILKREGHLFTCNSYSEFWNSYLGYPNLYNELLKSKVYQKGDKKRLSLALEPINQKLIEIAQSIIRFIESTISEK